MIATRKLMEEIRKKTTNNSAGTTVLSQPLIREEDGNTYVVVIPLVINKDDPDVMERPMIYLLCALDGKLLTAKPIPKELYGDKYPTTRLYQYKPKKLPESTYDELYLALDSARQSLLENPDTNLYRDAYDRYLSALCTTVPKDMQAFYRLLSSPPNNDKKMATQRTEEPSPEPEELPPAVKSMPKKETEPVQEEKNADPPKESVKPAFVWNPTANLSTMPEMTYRMHERLAEHIEFLESKEPGQLRIEYPLFCFEKDRNENGGQMQELLFRLNDGHMAKGHMRIAPKPSIYAKCPNAKAGCIFASCPYIIASYIKYLKQNDPGELKKQRLEYQKKKQSIDTRYLKSLPFKVTHPALADADNIKKGLVLLNSGLLEIQTDEELTGLTITWQRRTESSTELSMAHITKNELTSSTIFHDDMHGGEEIPEDVYRAILAYDSITAKPKEKEELPKKDPDPARSEEQKKEKTNLTVFMAEDSAFYRALANPKVKTIYGTYITPVFVTEHDSFVRAVSAALKEKGFSEIEIVKGTSNSIPRTGKINFVNLNGQTDFRTEYLTTRAAVILCGRPSEIERALNTPGAKLLYGSLKAEKPHSEYDSLYKTVMKLLPEAMQVESPGLDAFIRWISETPLPRTDENNIAEYIAWLCMIQDRCVFAEGE